METKHCSKCGLYKSPSEFSRNKSRLDGLCYWCKTCANTGNQKAYHADIEKSHAKARVKAVVMKIHKRAYHKEWYAKNREKKLIQNKEWSEAHKEEHSSMIAEWFKDNPGKSRGYRQTRMALHANSPINDLTDTQWEEILLAYNYRCVYCPLTCKACRNKTHKLHQDHITPLSKSGSYTVSNIVPACQSCNSKKGAGPVPKPIQPLLLTIAPPKGK